MLSLPLGPPDPLPSLSPANQVAFDKVLLLLCRFTGLIEQGRSQSRPSSRGNISAKGSSAEGTNGVTATRFVDETPAARTAAVTAFGIAHRLGDHMREGEAAPTKVLMCVLDGTVVLLSCICLIYFVLVVLLVGRDVVEGAIANNRETWLQTVRTL